MSKICEIKHFNGLKFNFQKVLQSNRLENIFFCCHFRKFILPGLRISSKKFPALARVFEKFPESYDNFSRCSISHMHTLGKPLWKYNNSLVLNNFLNDLTMLVGSPHLLENTSKYDGFLYFHDIFIIFKKSKYFLFS